MKTLKILWCSLLVVIATDVQAQLLYKTKFSALEGYTNGWMIGQPAYGNKWANANADWDWVYANEPTPEAYSPLNNGRSWIPDGATEPFLIVTATNTTAPGGGQMKVASDGNFGTNTGTYFWKMDIPKQMTGPITITWDWQFHCTNEIPADYNPKTNTYNSSLPGFDHGFGLADYANRAADGDIGNPNWKYSELSTGVRLSSRQDCRYNQPGACGGGGSWFDHGPEFKDGTVLHMKTIMYVANGANGDLSYANTYDNFVQRDGEEEIWQTAKHDGDPAWMDPHTGDPAFADPLALPEFGMRRCPGEVDPTSGINCIMCWMNGNQWSRDALISNIRVWGPQGIPTPQLRIDRSDTAKVKLTFTGWLQAADTPLGPYRDVALPSASPLEINAQTAAKYYRAEN
jgi:hypothetical protein